MYVPNSTSPMKTTYPHMPEKASVFTSGNDARAAIFDGNVERGTRVASW